MERPGSRGALALSQQGMGKAPTGSAVPMPDRPSTATSRGGPPPGTGLRGGGAPGGGGLLASGPPATALKGAAGAPPGTAYKRTGTASQRPGTGQQAAAAAAAAQRAGTTVQVENRPITNHGVSGMKVAASQGRQVLDKNYFMNELRQKRMEIAQVTQGMKVGGAALARPLRYTRRAGGRLDRLPSSFGVSAN